MDETLKNILVKAKSYFYEFGLRSVSMDDLCRHIGISKKTLYQYVDSKEDLISKMHEFTFKETSGRYAEIVNQDLNAIDILLEVSKRISQDLEEYNPSVRFDLEKYYPEIYKQCGERKRQLFLLYIKQNIERGIAQGLFRSDLDLDVELVACLYVQKLHSFHDTEIFATGNFPYEKIFAVMFENHIRGIATPKGIAYLEKQKQNLEKWTD